MLTADLIRPFLLPKEQTITVALLDEQNAYWLETAETLIALFQRCVGQSRMVWEQMLEDFEGARTDYLRIRGLAKVLVDEAVFAPRSTSSLPLDVRLALFQRGPVFTEWDLFRSHSRQEVLTLVATDLHSTAEDVEAAMFADHPSEQILVHLKRTWTPLQLLQRYNLELTRGVLYRATTATIEIWDNYKTIWRFLKLYNIMYWVETFVTGGYHVTLSGPMADFIRTERYGIAFAQFFPALLLGERWQLLATIATTDPREKALEAGSALATRSTLLYRLDQDCALSTHYKQGREFDSKLERTFAQEFIDFETKFGTERGRWRLMRESELLVLRKTVMIPDFCLEHVDDPQRRILIELVGFWTPKYLQTKLKKLREAQCAHMIVLVYEHLNVTSEDVQDIGSEVIFFKEKPVIKQILPVVEALAERIYGPLPPKKRRR